MATGTRLNMPAGIDANATNLTVFAERGLDTAPFYAAFESGEIVKVTTGGPDTEAWVVERGALSTTRTAHQNGERLRIVIAHEAAVLVAAGGGGSSLPGLTSDGQTPPGFALAGRLHMEVPGDGTSENWLHIQVHNNDGQKVITIENDDVALAGWHNGKMVSADSSGSFAALTMDTASIEVRAVSSVGYPRGDATVVDGYVDAYADAGTNAADQNQPGILNARMPLGLTADMKVPNLKLSRTGALNGHDYLQPMAWLHDSSGSDTPVFGISQAVVNGYPTLLLSIKSNGDILTKGGVSIGDPAAASVPTYSVVYGTFEVYDTPANIADDDYLMRVGQATSLTDDGHRPAVMIYRSNSLNGHQYLRPALRVWDNTGGTAPVAGFGDGTSENVTVMANGDTYIGGKLKSGAVETAAVGASAGKRLAIHDEAGTVLGYVDLRAAA